MVLCNSTDVCDTTGLLTLFTFTVTVEQHISMCVFYLKCE